MRISSRHDAEGISGTSLPEGSHPLQRHVRHLRYAVATTTSQATVDVLQQMLKEAETRLQKLNRASERV